MADKGSSISINEARIIVSSYVEGKHYEIISVKETEFGSERLGFMSDYLRLEITVRVQSVSEETYAFFAKTVPRNSGQHRDFVHEVQCYAKETAFYLKVIPVLEKYQKKLHIRRNKCAIGRWAPHCFFARDDIIVMEDLSAVGFNAANHRVLFDWNQCTVVMKKMAALHAATIIFEEMEKRVLGHSCRIVDLHKECFSTFLEKSLSGDEDKGWFAAGVRAAIALIPLLPKYHHSMSLQRTIQDKLHSVLNSITDLATSERFRNVVCHGDLWASNILFQYGEENQVMTARFVDYQILRYAPPAADIAIFIFTTTNLEFRDSHLENLLKMYYEEISKELEKYDINPNEQLSFEELKQSFEFFSTAGRSIAALYHQLTLMDSATKHTLFSSPENYTNFFLVNRSSPVQKCFQNDDIYRCRMEEILYEIIEKDILNK